MASDWAFERGVRMRVSFDDRFATNYLFTCVVRTASSDLIGSRAAIVASLLDAEADRDRFWATSA